LWLSILPLWLKALVLTLALSLLYLLRHHYTPLTPPPLLYIPETHQTGTLLAAMRQQGIPFNLCDYRLLRRYNTLKKGWVRFDPKQALSREDFLLALQKKPREKTRRIVMYAGDSMDDFALRTGHQTLLSPQKILAQYHRYSPYHEGGILAGYYQIPYHTTPSAIAYYCTLQSTQRLRTLSAKYLNDCDTKTWNRILTIASIVQKETQDPTEMPLISSVIQNRLAQGMKLQLDATLNYGIYSHRPVTPQRIREDDSVYNTYKHKGLPPHPIGSASEHAILAALQPAKTDYLYFMLADNGTHNFADTYTQHLAHIRWYSEQRERNLTAISTEENRSKNSTNQ